MSWASDFVKNMESGATDVAHTVAVNAGAVGQTISNLIKRGTPYPTVKAAMVSSGLLSPADVSAPQAGAVGFVPSYMGVPPNYGGGPLIGPFRPSDTEYRCGINPQTGQPVVGRRPFSFPLAIQLAGGSPVTAGTTNEFIATAACAALSAANKFPNNFISEYASLHVGAQVPASIVETLAVLNRLFIIEQHAGSEVARYPISQLYPYVGYSSLTTSGAGAALQKYDSMGVAFRQAWDPNTNYSLQLDTTKTFTPAAAIDLTFVLGGSIVR